MDVIVVGAGISGLTTAVCLVEDGFTVRIIAEKPPAGTTSANAGASWGPYLTDPDRVRAWSTRTRLRLEDIAATESASGVRLVRGMEVDVGSTTAPDWAAGLADFTPCRADALPAPYTVGWWFSTPLVDMPRYLAYLERRLTGAGVTVESGFVRKLDDIADQTGIVVNCTGLGARGLVGDVDLYPVRGQLVVVRNPGIDEFFQDSGVDGLLTYYLPHGDTVVLGGCAVPHTEVMDVDEGIAAAIIDRCAAIEPRLRNPVVLGGRVGLRPTRPQIRLEAEMVAGRPVIHNYGHGGSGVTVSWGCAEAVLDLARGL
jgi:D-amino-acid oxidase